MKIASCFSQQKLTVCRKIKRAKQTYKRIGIQLQHTGAAASTARARYGRLSKIQTADWKYTGQSDTKPCSASWEDISRILYEKTKTIRQSCIQ